MRLYVMKERIVVGFGERYGREGIVRRDQRGSCDRCRRWSSSEQRIALLGEKSVVLGSAQSIAVATVIIVGALFLVCRPLPSSCSVPPIPGELYPVSSVMFPRSLERERLELVHDRVSTHWRRRRSLSSSQEVSILILCVVY